MFIKYLTRFANVIVLLVLLQAAFFALLAFGLQRIYLPAGIVLFALSMVCVLIVATGESHPVFKLTWVIAIMAVPVLGGMVYVFYNRRNTDRLVEHARTQCLKRALEFEYVGEAVPADKSSRLIAAYLKNTVGFSPALSQNCKFFPVGEEKIAYLMAAMKKAEKYIFLEYFLIEGGVVWNSIYEILAQKASEGVDVRIICDGAGCLYPLPRRFAKHMAKAGIKVRVFNPVSPLISARISTRNHRKIAVIDGRVAFCGGLNLADPYANIKETCGHWKDSAVMTDGGTAWNMTLLFLSMWEFLCNGKEKVEYENFIPESINCQPSIVNCQLTSPMLDVPCDRSAVSEHTFINFISRAEKYVYITTPYLVCGGELLAPICAAARSGVDVRIITPYIADKKLVKLVTESNYRLLIENGVRVFEYLPGFIHAKNILADGNRAMVGTVNLDYRSLYLHYECGVCLFGEDSEAIAQIDRDFTETFAQCKEITLDDLDKVSLFKRTLQRVARLFAPFL